MDDSKEGFNVQLLNDCITDLKASYQYYLLLEVTQS